MVVTDKAYPAAAKIALPERANKWLERFHILRNKAY